MLERPKAQALDQVEDSDQSRIPEIPGRNKGVRAYRTQMKILWGTSQYLVPKPYDSYTMTSQININMIVVVVLAYVVPCGLCVSLVRPVPWVLNPEA